MSPYAIKILDVPGLLIGEPMQTPCFLRAYDPTVGYPLGNLQTTQDPSLALHFASFSAALAFWTQQVGGNRWDGKPNRPLTALTVEIVPV